MTDQQNVLNVFLGSLFVFFSVAANATPQPKPENISINVTLKKNLVTYLRSEKSPLNSKSNNISKNTVSNLSSLLEHPHSLEPAYPITIYPDHVKVRSRSSFDKLSRQITLTYSAMHDAQAMVKSLKSNLEIESASIVNNTTTDISTFSASEPNDTFYPERPSEFGPSEPTPFGEYQSWYLEMMDIPHAWDYGTGHANVAIVDQGFDLDHPDLQKNWRKHWSYDFYLDSHEPNSSAIFFEGNETKGHGTHVMGLIGADSNNNMGSTGVCQNCNLYILKFSSLGDWSNSTKKIARSTQRQRAISWAIESGAQIVNLSFGKNTQDSCDEISALGMTEEDFIVSISDRIDNNTLNSKITNMDMNRYCTSIEMLKKNDIAFIVASGNSLKDSSQFPASEKYPIAVGGVDATGNLWDDRPNCPYGSSLDECGSNGGAEFIAPAKNILSTMDIGFNYNDDYNCGDSYATGQNDGYGSCSGTSFAAPLVSASFGLLRSLNPLLTVDELRDTLHDTASNSDIGYFDESIGYVGYGIPKVGNASEKILGTSNTSQLENRLNPVFVLYNNGTNLSIANYYGLPLVTNDRPIAEPFSVKKGYFFTSKPQEANAAIIGYLYENPKYYFSNNDEDRLGFDDQPIIRNPYPYVASTAGEPVKNYIFPETHLSITSAKHEAKSAFSVFANKNNPFGDADLVPLYRLSFANESCSIRDFQYTTQQEGIDHFTSVDYCPDEAGIQSYRLDGIMGYIFSNGDVPDVPSTTFTNPVCPENMICNDYSTPTSDPKALQCLHRRYSSDNDNWALIVQNELNNSEYAGYTETAGNISCIGYVFPNEDEDNDGVTNGQELILGTDINNNDSDCDGYLDGQEYPLADLPQSDPMDGLCEPTQTGSYFWKDDSTAQTGGVNHPWHFAMGYHFTANANGYVDQLAGYFNGTKIVKLFKKSTGQVLAQTTITSANSWSFSDISSIPLEAGSEYTVAVYLNGSGGSFGATNQSFPKNYGDITINGGTYIYSAGNSNVIPTNLITGHIFGQVDIRFTATSPPVDNNAPASLPREQDIIERFNNDYGPYSNKDQLNPQTLSNGKKVYVVNQGLFYTSIPSCLNGKYAGSNCAPTGWTMGIKENDIFAVRHMTKSSYNTARISATYNYYSPNITRANHKYNISDKPGDMTSSPFNGLCETTTSNSSGAIYITSPGTEPYASYGFYCEVPENTAFYVNVELDPSSYAQCESGICSGLYSTSSLQVPANITNGATF